MDPERFLKSCVWAAFPSAASRENSLGRKLALELDRIVTKILCNFIKCVKVLRGFKNIHVKGNGPGSPVSR
jgi:hypothetical protein